jgi:hypothetical protein
LRFYPAQRFRGAVDAYATFVHATLNSMINRRARQRPCRSAFTEQ